MQFSSQRKSESNSSSISSGFSSLGTVSVTFFEGKIYAFPIAHLTIITSQQSYTDFDSLLRSSSPQLKFNICFIPFSQMETKSSPFLSCSSEMIASSMIFPAFLFMNLASALTLPSSSYKCTNVVNLGEFKGYVSVTDLEQILNTSPLGIIRKNLLVL